MFILKNLISIVRLLNISQKRDLFLMWIFFSISAVVQLIGVASVAPFISLLSDPEIIQTNATYQSIYNYLSISSKTQFTIIFAIASIALIFLSNLAAAITLWLLFNFSVKIGAQIQSKLFKNYLFKDYIFHKTENYNQIIANISQETPRFVYMILQPFLLLLSQSLIAILIIGGLIFLNPVVAISSALIIGSTYGFTYFAVKKSLINNGKIITQRNNLMQSILSECFIGIKDIKLSHTENTNIERLNKINFKGLSAQANVVLTGDIPKFAIETVSFGAILILAIVALLNGADSKKLTVILSVYAIAGYKLLPTMQQIYKSISNISANADVIEMLKRDLISNSDITQEKKKTRLIKINSIELRNSFYVYPGNRKAGIFDVSLNFKLGQLYTVAGESGSGKSTLADIILGLLPLQKGMITINDQQQVTRDIIGDYQSSLSYVPQSIFILDDDLISNVAFGIPKEEIDIKKVEEALCKAQAWEFVQKLPQGIHTQLGQDGRLLSGGQRQRIGIARALYSTRMVMILDEPTSALDIQSEYEIMRLLQELKNEILIIVISHRPSAIKLSDEIILINDGKFQMQGSYEVLYKSNENFKELMRKGFGENHESIQTSNNE